MINSEERISKLEKQVKRLINQICCADAPIALAWGGITGTLADQTDLATELGDLETDISTKENALTFTSPYFSRVGDTISIADAVSDQVTKGIATFNSNDFNSLNGLISLDYTNGQAASATVNGYMTTGTQAFAGNKTWGGTSTFTGTAQIGGTTNGVLNISSNAASVRGAIDLSSNNPRLNSLSGSWVFASAGGTIGVYNATGWFFGGGTPPANARVQILAGTTTIAPFKLNSGVNLTTPVTGCMEYDGTTLFFTRTGTTRETVWVGPSGATAPATAAAGSVTNRYGGATNFLGDPDSWGSMVINGTTFKVPLYT